MKILIESVGPHAYVDPTTMGEISSFRPSVVSSTEYIGTLTSRGKIKVLDNQLLDSATDAEFLKFWKASDKDKELAVDSFLGKFSSKPKLEKGPAPKKPNEPLKPEVSKTQDTPPAQN